jgi:hypothetical protein
MDIRIEYEQSLIRKKRIEPVCECFSECTAGAITCSELLEQSVGEFSRLQCIGKLLYRGFKRFFIERMWADLLLPVLLDRRWLEAVRRVADMCDVVRLVEDGCGGRFFNIVVLGLEPKDGDEGKVRIACLELACE